MKNFVVQFITNRLLWLFIIIAVLFYLLVVRLFELQIIRGEQYKNDVRATTLKDLTVLAPRGTIYDRNGVPLAVNESSFNVNIDPSVNVADINRVLLDLNNLLERNGEEILDNFPISSEKPYTFLYGQNENLELQWKNNMNLDKGLTAEECFNALKKRFKIDENFSDEDARKILSLRCELYLFRYSKFRPITIAYDVKTETIASIEEHKSDFPAVYVDVEPLRKYSQGKYFSHILGYIRGITTEELKSYEQYGYVQTDIIGKDGIEKAFEMDLKGIDGKRTFEVDSFGSKMRTLDSETVEPIPGKKVFLTVDAHLQKYIYDELEITLKNVLVNKLTGKNRWFNYTLKQLFASMVSSGNISVKKIMDAPEDSVSSQVKKYAMSVTNDDETDIDALKKAIEDGINRGSVTPVQMTLILHEQGIITGDDDYVNRIKRGRISPLSVVIEKLNALEITPQMTALDPSTGAVMLTDVNTGEVLAAVTYPSYDNNELVNVFNNSYYLRLQEDPTFPLSNRPFMEPRAPGSTFKMIPAVAGLEEGVITTTSRITDRGTFTDAGRPYAKCWIGSGGGHGSINVSRAIEVSCNYFFYDLSYRLGNIRNDRLSGINTLNKYMRDFGLDSLTGVEIYELYNSTSEYGSNISSPEYKRYVVSRRNPDAPEGELIWSHGDTIRTAIGQAYNNYTPAVMAKYIATLANGGTRYSLHFHKKTVSYDGETAYEYEKNVENVLDIEPKNLKAVHEGMLAVTSGVSGTIRGVYKNFPVQVAAKTGTAQQSSKRSDHTWFVGFAPYDEPQISISVCVPFGDDSTQPAGTLAKNVIAEYMGLNVSPETTKYNVIVE